MHSCQALPNEAVASEVNRGQLEEAVTSERHAAVDNQTEELGGYAGVGPDR